MVNFSTPLALSLLAAGCFWVIWNPSGALAQEASSLQELSRQMLGTNFEPDDSLTIEGNSSVVEAGRQSVKPVVGNLIDEEVRRRPGAARPAGGASSASKTVQLIIPVKTGLEFAQIQQIEPGVKILELDGRVFVLVRETAQALPVYQRGKQLQQKFGYGFELAYSDGHPDLNLAWMGALNPDLAAQPKPAVQPVAAAKPPNPIKAPRLGKAKDLGLLSLVAPWRPQVKDPKLAEQVSSTVSVIQSVPLAATLPSLAKSDNAQPVQQRVTSRTSLRDVLAELRRMKPAPASVATAAVPVSGLAQQPKPADLRSLVQPVAIRPSHLGETPIISSRFMAVNQDLAYLFVKVRNSDDLIGVQKVAPVTVVHDRNGDLLARVGVYTQSRTGERMLDQQLRTLQQSGYQVELIAARTSSRMSDQA